MHHYLPLDPSVHEEGSKVGGPLDLTIGSHFGSTPSKFKTLLNPNYTYVPLTYYVVLLGLCDFENFHISHSHSTLHQSSKDRGGKQGWSSTRPYHRKSLWVDLFKIQNPYKSQLHFTPSFLFCILSIFDNFENFHISQTPTLHFLSSPGTMTGSKVDGPQEGTIGLRVKFDLVKIQNPYKSILRTLPSYLL